MRKNNALSRSKNDTIDAHTIKKIFKNSNFEKKKDSVSETKQSVRLKVINGKSMAYNIRHSRKKSLKASILSLVFILTSTDYIYHER